jgi:Flp pilus assembly protein CpaB
MYGRSVSREAGLALVLVATLAGLVATALTGEPAYGARAQEAAQQQLPMLPEIVVTATRLDA